MGELGVRAGRDDPFALSQLEAEVNHLTALLNASALVAGSLDLDTVLRELVSQAALVLRARGASLLLLDDERDELVFRVAYGEKGADLRERRFPKGAGIAGSVVSTGEPVLVANAQADPRHLDQFDRELGFRTGSLMAVPVQVRGRILGVLEVLNPGPEGPFTEDDLGLLVAFAGHAGLALDNARRHASMQRQLMLVMEGMQDGLLLLDEAGEVSLINPAARTLLGLPPHGSIAREDIVELPCEPGLLETVGSDRPVEVRVKRNGQAERMLRVLPSQLRDVSPSQPGTVVVLHDVSRLRELERLKSDLITMVSHELRTPVASIQGAAQLLGSGTVDPVSGEGRKFFDIIQRNADRLGGIVVSIVDLAQLGVGSLEVTPQPCPLADVIADALEAKKGVIASAGHRIESKVPDNLPDVWADGGRIVQVLRHLLDNAAKFTPRGGRITVACQLDGEWITVRVTDTGPGIPPADRERAFEAFEQLSDPRREKVSGTGLGLPIARGIVEASGGRMWIDSPEGATGTSVVFALPVYSPGRR